MGVESTWNCLAGSRRAVWLQRQTELSSPGIEPGPRPSQGRVRIRNTPRTYHFQRLAEESNPVLQLRTLPCFSGTLARRSFLSIPTWIRTRAWTFGGSNAIRYTIGTQEPTTGFAPALPCLQDRRLSMSSHVGKHEREESNPVGRFWRPLPLPGGRSFHLNGTDAGFWVQPFKFLQGCSIVNGVGMIESRGPKHRARIVGKFLAPWSRRQIFDAPTSPLVR